MFNNYIQKVPRSIFEERIKKYKSNIFAPEGPIIRSNEIYFSYKYGKRRIRIVSSLSEADYLLSDKPYLERQIMAIFNRMVKYPKYDIKNLPITFDIKQIMYSNPKFDNKMIPFAVAYDMNSAFNYAEITNDIPDTSREYTGKIKRGDIGIRLYKDKWIFAYSGNAYKCFPLIKWNAKKFVDLYYKRKQEATSPEKRQQMKDFLTHHVGSMKHHNQIIRCWIIWNSNCNIEKYKDENTLIMNTDCLISLVERPDMPISTEEIGKFKETNRGRFAKKNMDYQFYDSGTIKKRGLALDLRENFDILKSKNQKSPIIKESVGFNFVKGKFRR